MNGVAPSVFMDSEVMLGAPSVPHMNASAPHLDAFIRRLHRRFVVVRLAERIGTCLLIGSGGGALILPIFWWQGGSAMPLIILILLMAAGVGVLMSALRRPTLLQAALEADRQLNLADLLSTACSIPGNSDAWGSTLRALADARCKQLSTSQVILNRWGKRRWGGVGLVLALLLALSMLSSQSPPLQAASESQTATDSLGVPIAPSHSVAYSATARLNGTHQPAIDDNPSADNATPQTSRATSTDKSASATPPSAIAHTAPAGDPNGSGAAATATFPPSALARVLPQGASTSAASGHGPTANGGQADSQTDGRQGDVDPASGVAAAKHAAKIIPPWSTSTWIDDQNKAESQIRSAPTYDPYRLLIQQYFASQ